MNRHYIDRRIVARALFALAGASTFLLAGLPYEAATGARRARPVQFLYEEVQAPVPFGIPPPPETPSAPRGLFRFTVNVPIHDAAGRTVPGLRPADFRAVSADGTDTSYRVVKVELQRDVSQSAKSRSLSISLLFDMSGSLHDNDPQSQRVDAAIRFVRSLPAGVRISLCTFSGKGTFLGLFSGVRERMGFTTDREAMVGAIENLRGDTDGGTPLYAGLQFAAHSLESEPAGYDRHLICFTDGQADDRSLSGVVEQEASGNGIKVHFIALGSTSNWDGIRATADKTGGRLVECQSADLLDNSFEEMTRIVSDRSYYRVEMEATRDRPFGHGDSLALQVDSTHPRQAAAGHNARFGISVP